MNQLVTLSMNIPGQVIVDPQKPVVSHTDTLSWKSDQGDLVVWFDDDPFENGKQFSAKKGEETVLCKIRPSAASGPHQCRATINGVSGEGYGFDIQP